jgi:integrase
MTTEDKQQRKKKRARRGRGEGSIFQRGDGQWVGSISLGYTETGRRNRRTVYGATKQEVLDELDRLRTDARVGSLPDAGGMTVGQLLDRWLQSSKSRTETRTFEERERVVKNHLRPRLGGMKLAKLTALHVEGLYADMARDGVGATTVRNAATMLGAALSHACKLKLIPFNPAGAVSKPKEPAREMLFLTPAQVKILLAVAQDQRCYPLLVLAVATGCRQGELLALTWEDIDLQKGTLTVRRSLAQANHGFEVKEPKTAASRRTIALPDLAVSVLTQHKAAMMKAGLLGAPVFCTRNGGYLLKRNVLRSLRAVIRRANTPPGKFNKGGRPKKDAPPRPKEPFEPLKLIPAKLRFHDLRHTHASVLLSQGQSVRAVSQRLGHSNPALTLRIYAHCMPSDDEQLAAGLNRLLG